MSKILNTPFPYALARVAVAALAVAAAGAHAQSFSGTVDTSAAFSPTNQSTDGTTYYDAPASGPYPAAAVTVGEFDFTPIAGTVVSSVTVSGDFGSDALGSGTAPVDLFLDAIEVASCDAACAAASQAADVAWSFAIPTADLAAFANGSVVLTAVQQGDSQIVLDPTSITVDVSAVPEPADLALLLAALPLVAAGARRARKNAVRA